MTGVDRREAGRQAACACARWRCRYAVQISVALTGAP